MGRLALLGDKLFMERALVLVFNWTTKESSVQVWEEDNAGAKAYQWARGLETEYSAALGWTFCVHMNQSAAQRFADQIPSKPKA
jgi:hypothetical protein